ncbi:MAG: hypothetical protein LBU22_07845 [Dysgonamonadaceae bacterium]|jgi:hypothetical protein|nr:hypothetical protein [Dysgonamonadaceae bacterium]
MCSKSLIIIQLLLFIPFGLCGQDRYRETLFTDDFSIRPNEEGSLRLSIDNTSFLKNNEFDGDIQKGYTLPGFRFSPRLVYTPISFVRLEAGLTLLRYWGTDKYPQSVYQRIPDWKTERYQYGFHLRPFFRAQIQPHNNLSIVFGNVFGGANHKLIDPLYDAELNYTADPELGAQMIYNSKIAHVDAWVDWKRFIFKNDTHNETVTVGISSCLHLLNPQQQGFYMGIPVQVLLTHQGGELDIVQDTIFSVANGSAGLRFGFNFGESVVESLQLDVMGLGANLFFSDKDAFPFTKGWAFYSGLKVKFKYLQANMNFWRSGNFVNIMGNPVFGNLSTTIEGRTFPRTMVLNPGLKYEQTFDKAYHLGIDAEIFYNPRLYAYYRNSDPIQITKSFSWSTGLYLRINPSIILKKSK